jgi:hypothetical protein
MSQEVTNLIQKAHEVINSGDLQNGQMLLQKLQSEGKIHLMESL